MGVLGWSTEKLRQEVGGFAVLLAVYVAPIEGIGRGGAGFLYHVFLKGTLSEPVVSVLTILLGLFGGAMMTRPLFRVPILAGFGLAGLAWVAGTLVGNGAADAVTGLGIVLGFLAVLYVFGEGKEGRH